MDSDSIRWPDDPRDDNPYIDEAIDLRDPCDYDDRMLEEREERTYKEQ